MIQHLGPGQNNAVFLIAQHQQAIPGAESKNLPGFLGDNDLAFIADFNRAKHMLALWHTAENVLSLWHSGAPFFLLFPLFPLMHTCLL